MSFCGRFQPAGVLLIAGLSLSTARAEIAPLPEPLTLGDALALVDEDHPVMEQARAALAGARAGQLAAEALTGLNVTLEGRARWIEPADVAVDQSSDDHKAALVLRKNLYDFGRSAARRGAAEAALRASDLLLTDARQQRRITIMRRYFDVVLADMRANRENEALALAYIDLDRLQNRQELGQVSDLRIAESDAAYQRVRRQFAASQAEQRATRARLALALNRPGSLPSTVVMPQLPQLDRELPEFDQLIEEAYASNPRLQALRAQVDSARELVDAARAGRRPQLVAEVEAAEYARDTGSSDPWRAGITLEVPLWTGGAVESAVAQREADLARVRSDLRQAEFDVREAILDHWLELSTLRIEREAVDAEQWYRELYLERSRVVYEMDVKADLGDAMVHMSDAQIAAAGRDFRAALVWERLDALTGKTVGASDHGAVESGEETK